MGLIWDMNTGTVYVTSERMDKLTFTLQDIVTRVSRGKLEVTARQLAG